MEAQRGIDLGTSLEVDINLAIQVWDSPMYCIRCRCAPNVSQPQAWMYLSIEGASSFSPTTPFLKILMGLALGHLPSCASHAPSAKNYNIFCENLGRLL